MTVGEEQTLRPLREADVDQVVELYRQAWGDARPMDREELLSWLRNPGIDPESMRVLEVGDTVIGYGDVFAENGVLALEVAAPGQWLTFLKWAEAVGTREGVHRVRVVSYAGDSLATVAGQRGYRLWRSNYTMRIDFEREPEADQSPLESFDVRTFAPDNAGALRAALDEAFAADPFFSTVTPERFRESYLGARGFDSSLWLLAWFGDELVGFVLAYTEFIGEEVGYIHSLGVRPEWRGRGIGAALLRVAFQRLYRVGLGACVLGVDASNATGAARLYERVGMRVLRQSDNWSYELQPAPSA